ncbi:MAG: dihydrodipicolinate synthase family protein [Planctomycetota bacterium]|jgi:N-acetylneuraminate lyase|nr:dihydrodipicolinate synthase family protein [Planctomycetota bacterium]
MSDCPLIAATLSPFANDGTLDLGVVDDYAARLRGDGVAGVFVNGTTGEGLALSDDERRRAAEAWLARRAPDFRVMIHVGHLVLGEAQNLARHAADHGADGIAACAPCFVKPDAVAMAAWLEAIAAAAPQVPLYYYHIPGLAGTSFPASEVLRRAPSVHGVKFTHESLLDFQRCVDLDDGRLDCLFGRDECLLAGLAHGAVGAVGSTYNWAAPHYCALIAAWQRGDLAAARAHQRASQELVAIMQAHGGLASVKALMACAGLDCGQPRLPIRGAELAAIRPAYQAWAARHPLPASQGVSA